MTSIPTIDSSNYLEIHILNDASELLDKKKDICEGKIVYISPSALDELMTEQVEKCKLLRGNRIYTVQDLSVEIYLGILADKGIKTSPVTLQMMRYITNYVEKSLPIIRTSSEVSHPDLVVIMAHDSSSPSVVSDHDYILMEEKRSTRLTYGMLRLYIEYFVDLDRTDLTIKHKIHRALIACHDHQFKSNTLAASLIRFVSTTVDEYLDKKNIR